MNEFNKSHSEAKIVSKKFDNDAVLALEKRFGSRARLLTHFMRTMSENGMPEAIDLYTEKPAIKTPSFIGKFILDPLFGKKPTITGGAPVKGYAIGARMASRSGGDYAGLVYLCEDLKFRIHENAAGQYDEQNTEIATDLGDTRFFIGQLYNHKEKAPKSSLYYQHDGPKFRRMPLVDVLNNITADKLYDGLVIPVQPLQFNDVPNRWEEINDHLSL